MDIRRDRKTLAFLALSAWLLPLLAVVSNSLASSVILHAAVVDMDCSSRRVGVVSISSRLFAERIAGLISSLSRNTIVDLYECRRPRGDYDLIVIIPRGFTLNLTNTSTPAYLRLLYYPGSQAAHNLYNLVRYVVVPIVSREAARLLVEGLASLAGVRANPDAILDPVRVETGYLRVSSATGREIEAAVQAAHLLAFATIFVLAPASMITSDLFAGERERRNLEMLFTTPLSASELVAGKMIAASIVAAISGVLDAASMLAYLAVSGIRFPAPSYTLLAVHVASTMLAIMVTSALTALTVMSGVPSRIATLASSLYTLLAFFVYASSLTIDYTRLPPLTAILLSLIPYTHSVNAVILAARGDVSGSLASLAILAAYTIGVTIVSARVANPERIVRST